MRACDNFQKKRSPKKVMLDKAFAGVKAGQILFVGTPEIIAHYITNIPAGETSSIMKMRNQLARRHKCDATCPASTAIFVRIVAEYALEEMAEGKTTADVVPFWRLIDPNDKIAKKLPIDPQWIQHQRLIERGA
jgi:hypothetical protein